MHLKVFLLVISLQGLYTTTTKVLTEKEGFCVRTWTSRNATFEPYSYTKRVMVQEQCGWRTCLRERVQNKTDTRLVHRDVTNTEVECCEGYEKKSIHGEHFDCVPICDPACEEGHCVAPGNCTCFHGYRHATASKCVPSCVPECINGKCTSPGVCECNVGYYKVNGSYCAPNCSSPCINGLCVKPNECICESGYQKSPIDPFLCTPLCFYGCINSTCVNINECACFEGYYKPNDHQTNVCSPYCSLECINGECIEPDTCTCKEGYFFGNNSQNLCVPHCNCTNGFCIEPYKCMCFENYTLHEGDCVPVCDNCINATCTAPYTCECLEGFRSLNNTACTPHCSDCLNGVCTAPEVCSCLPGYRKIGPNASDSCEPVCESGCANGICTSPNNCTCESEIEKIEENLCYPVCTNTSSSEYGCFTTERTSIVTAKNSLFHLRLKVNCSQLYMDKNFTCDFDTCNKSNCTGFPLECSAVKNIKDEFKLICLWGETSHYGNLSHETYYSIYEETITSILHYEHLNVSENYNKEIAMTVLLPQFLTSEEADCELCSCSSDFRWTEQNKVNFQLFPCPSALKEGFANPRDYLIYFIIGGIIAAVLAALAILTIFLNRGKLHEYMVTGKYEKGLNNDVYDEPMIIEERET